MKQHLIKNYNNLFVDIFSAKYNLVKKKKKIKLYTFFSLVTDLVGDTQSNSWLNKFNFLFLYLFISLIKAKKSTSFLQITKKKQTGLTHKLNFFNSWHFTDWVTFYLYFKDIFSTNYAQKNSFFFKDVKTYNHFYLSTLKFLKFSKKVFNFFSFQLQIKFYAKSFLKKEQFLNYYLTFLKLV